MKKFITYFKKGSGISRDPFLKKTALSNHSELKKTVA